jgi:hypothetical protein
LKETPHKYHWRWSFPFLTNYKVRLLYAHVLNYSREQHQSYQSGIGFGRCGMKQQDQKSASVSLLKENKKRKGIFFIFSLIYGRFLRTSKMTAPTTTIAIMIPMTAGTKYRSIVEAGVGVGVACAAGSFSTTSEFSAVEP